MTQIVEPGPTTAPSLPLPKTDVLADHGKGVSCYPDIQPPFVLANEEGRRRHRSEDPDSLGAVSAKALGGARRERNDTAPSVLGMPDMQEGRIEIDIRIVESASSVLDRAVLDAIAEWQYEPAEKDGVKVRVQMRFRQKFTLGS